MRLNGKTIWIVLVIFLLGTNITMMVSYRNHLKSDVVDTGNKVGVPDSQLGRFFNEELDLTADQQEHFRAMRRKYNRNANQILSQMNTVRNQMGRVLESVHPDKDQFDTLAEKLGQNHVELKQLTFEYYNELQEVLNPDQQSRMVEIFQSMLNEEGNAKTPAGQRRGQGYGQGRNQMNSQDIHQKED